VTHALETDQIRKSFAGVEALKGVDFAVHGGTIHALLGQNGAGKSTLVKILNGVYPTGSYDGAVRLGGEPASFHSTADARKRGIGYVPQEIQTLEHLTVAENVYVGQISAGRAPLVRFRDLYRRAGALLTQLEIDLDARATVASLSAAQRQLLMVARALASRPSVLMLDEPTTSLAIGEAKRLFEVLAGLRAHGTTTVFITHRIPEVMEICDRATVLRDGRVVAEFERSQFDENDIVAAMVGRRLERLFPAKTANTIQTEVLRVERLRVARTGGGVDVVSNISFSLRRGEILGLAGLLGSGRTEVLSAVYGSVGHEGRIFVENRLVRIQRPANARRAGIAMLTEDRKRDGLLFNLPLRENITIGNLEQVARHALIDRRAEARRAVEFMQALAIKARSPAADVAHLSGGNQQKVLLARVLMNRPKVLLLDEPTKGVDVETKQEIYRLVVELASQGVSLLLVSSEISELLGLCDRCLVLARGRIVDEFVRGEGSEERVIAAATTASAAA
jgi:ribose transport system ATP-binding protein